MNKIATFLGLSALSIASAQAAVPAAVSTAITEAGTDAATVAGAVLIVVVGLLAFHFMRREVK